MSDGPKREDPRFTAELLPLIGDHAVHPGIELNGSFGDDDDLRRADTRTDELLKLLDTAKADIAFTPYWRPFLRGRRVRHMVYLIGRLQEHEIYRARLKR